MYKSTNKPTKSDRIHNALALANTVQRRRENLQMSVERAADLRRREQIRIYYFSLPGRG